MPRTKAPKKIAAASISERKKVLEKIEQIMKLEHEHRRAEREELRLKMHKFIEQNHQFRMMTCSNLDQTIGELKMKQSTSISSIRTNNASAKKDTTFVKKKRSLSCPTEDDDGSQLSTASRSTRASRSKFCNPLTKSTRVRKSRSLSKGNGYKTPANKQPANTYGMITPKMKPNTPQLILRRPKHGEVAVSLEGSPLMVNPVESDHAANVNIPLPGGNLLSLQPEQGFRMSLMPQLDPETAKQLEVLGEHIKMICNYTKRNNIG